MLIVIKALFTIIPIIAQMVQEGKIKSGAYDELMVAFNDHFDARVNAAKAAAKGTTDESSDPNNRSR